MPKIRKSKQTKHRFAVFSIAVEKNATTESRVAVTLFSITKIYFTVEQKRLLQIKEYPQIFKEEVLFNMEIRKMDCIIHQSQLRSV